MGLDFNGTRFLLYAQRLGVKYDNTVLIGRQSLDLTKLELKSNLQAFGYSIDSKSLNDIYNKGMGYAELLFAHLGAKNVYSVDASAYEGATNIHDMNQPIPSEYKERHSVVLDGGSIEHIFNFPVAIKNCMEMLMVGGHYLGITPANNFMGHGFYQFSPELYFSVFTQQNGFELVSLVAFEDKPESTWYLVKSPKEVKDRVLLVNDQPVYLLVIAKKIAKVNIFETIPQQSDYLSIWQSAGSDSIPPKSPNNRANRIPFRNWLKRNLPHKAKHLIQNTIQGHGFNSNIFIPLDPTKAKAS